MAEHHGLVSVHNEKMAPPSTAHLASYRTLSEVTAGQPHNVGKNATDATSDDLNSRYPYPQDVEYDFQEPSIAYGRNGVSKTLQVLRELVDDTGGDAERNTMLKQQNIEKLKEALSDHRSIGDTVNSTQQSFVVGLLKELLLDADPGVRQGAAASLGRLAMLIQGRQALCQSGCAESLAAMLEVPQSFFTSYAFPTTLLHVHACMHACI
jgi:hypothetical protein